MKIIFPIGGKGSRFLDKADENPEYLKPKPLINVLGKPMIKWAAESFSELNPEDIIFSVMPEHVEKFHIDEELKKIFGEKIKIAVDTVLKGALPGLLVVDEYIDDDECFISVDCDAVFEGDKFLKTIVGKNPDCAVPVFEADSPKFSFAKVDENMNITETAEKVVISNWAIHGAYYFKSWKKFKEFAEDKIRKSEMDGKPEYYIAPLINKYIENELKGLAVPCKVDSMGTPEQLDEFIKNFNDKRVIIGKN